MEERLARDFEGARKLAEGRLQDLQKRLDKKEEKFRDKLDRQIESGRNRIQSTLESFDKDSSKNEARQEDKARSAHAAQVKDLASEVKSQVRSLF